MNAHNPYASPSQDADDPTQETEYKRGRAIIVLIIVFLLATELISFGTPRNVIRLLATLVLLVFLYRGNAWARYLIVGLIAISVVAAFALLPLLIGRGVDAHLWWYVFFDVGHVVCGVTLVVNRSVAYFLSSQRAQRTGQQLPNAEISDYTSVRNCPNCDREVSVHTRFCPRCDTNLVGTRDGG